MFSAGRESLEGAAGSELVHGLVLGSALAIPLWAGIGIVAIVLFQEGPVTEVETAALMVAAAVELLLLRTVWRAFRPRIAVRRPAARSGVRPPLMKQTVLLASLVGSYLNYYFWDIQLQISSLQSVTVFVPV